MVPVSVPCPPGSCSLQAWWRAVVVLIIAAIGSGHRAQAKGLLITRPDKRTQQETLTIERMKLVECHMGECCYIFEEFARLFWERDSYVGLAGYNRARAVLRRWIEEAKESEIPESKAFAAKFLQHIEAVVTATVVPYSQRQRVGSTSSSSSGDRCTGGLSSIC
jgi:hypothetical protein